MSVSYRRRLIMEDSQSYKLLIRRMGPYSNVEEMYRITLFKKIKVMEDFLGHPEVASLMSGRVVRIERVDNFRFNLYIRNA